VHKRVRDPGFLMLPASASVSTCLRLYFLLLSLLLLFLLLLMLWVESRQLKCAF